MLKQIIKDELVKFKIEENDQHYEDLIFSMPLNESISWNDIKGYLGKIVNKASVLQKAIKKFNMSKNTLMKRYLLMIIFSILTMSSGNTGKASKESMIDNIKMSELEKLATEQAKRDSIDYANAVAMIKEFKVNKIKRMTTSENGLAFIKKHESYRDKAYKLGDGMITIGYGHAERIGKSKYDIGDQITREEAEALFREDVKKAENGVKRILLKIFKDGGNVDVTQNMFDALVSMAYNMGVYGLATTEFIDAFANSENSLTSAELIKTSRVGKWKGLKKRRQQEYDLFVSNTKDNSSLS